MGKKRLDLSSNDPPLIELLQAWAEFSLLDPTPQELAWVITCIRPVRVAAADSLLAMQPEARFIRHVLSSVPERRTEAAPLLALTDNPKDLIAYFLHIPSERTAAWQRVTALPDDAQEQVLLPIIECVPEFATRASQRALSIGCGPETLARIVGRNNEHSEEAWQRLRAQPTNAALRYVVSHTRTFRSVAAELLLQHPTSAQDLRSVKYHDREFAPQTKRLAKCEDLPDRDQTVVPARNPHGRRPPSDGTPDGDRRRELLGQMRELVKRLAEGVSANAG